MLEKPSLEDKRITDCIRAEYGISARSLEFLPLGADRDTAVYRIVANDEKAFFLKLRRGEFCQASVVVPNFLFSQGINEIIPSIPTQMGFPWANLPPYTMILYPFVSGANGFEKELTDYQWIEFGAALKKVHTADYPDAIIAGIRHEDFSPYWRDTLMRFLEQIQRETFEDPVAAEAADFLKSKMSETVNLVSRAERLAQRLIKSSPEFILCHGDIHAWNLLITAQGAMYMVDWDTLIIAPKERDLMFIAGGLGGTSRTPLQEETLFYQGYGQTGIDPFVLTYYRFERIVEDIAVFCAQLFQSEVIGEDRRQALEYMKSNFIPNGAVDLAFRSAGNLIGYLS